jgi:hypothetical protein
MCRYGDKETRMYLLFLESNSDIVLSFRLCASQ